VVTEPKGDRSKQELIIWGHEGFNFRVTVEEVVTSDLPEDDLYRPQI
jgi:hypothetical protein